MTDTEPVARAKCLDEMEVGWLHRRLLPAPQAGVATVAYAVAAAHLMLQA